jgi:hypothetical protein
MKSIHSIVCTGKVMHAAFSHLEVIYTIERKQSQLYVKILLKKIFFEALLVFLFCWVWS